MSINIDVESLILFSELPNHLPRKGGKKIALPTCYRWRNQGLCGVRLEVVYIAGIVYTSRESLRRFDELVTAAKLAPSLPIAKATPKQASRAHERAKAKLASS
jgi:hypothetical protein